MTDKLVTVVDNIMDRLLLLEATLPAASTYATSRWIELRQNTPYWVNRIAALNGGGGSEDLPWYDLTVQMRLIVSYEAGVMHENGINSNVQVSAWAYIPQVVRYFENNRGLDLAGSTTLTHIDVARVTITCRRGLDLQVLPLSREILLSIDFELTLPLQVGRSE